MTGRSFLRTPCHLSILLLKQRLLNCDERAGFASGKEKLTDFFLQGVDFKSLRYYIKIVLKL